jgi:hypothetical protein
MPDHSGVARLVPPTGFQPTGVVVDVAHRLSGVVASPELSKIVDVGGR